MTKELISQILKERDAFFSLSNEQVESLKENFGVLTAVDFVSSSLFILYGEKTPSNDEISLILRHYSYLDDEGAYSKEQIIDILTHIC